MKSTVKTTWQVGLGSFGLPLHCLVSFLGSAAYLGPAWLGFFLCSARLYMAFWLVLDFCLGYSLFSNDQVTWEKQKKQLDQVEMHPLNDTSGLIKFFSSWFGLFFSLDWVFWLRLYFRWTVAFVTMVRGHGMHTHIGQLDTVGFNPLQLYLASLTLLLWLCLTWILLLVQFIWVCLLG